jgi:cytochrome c556
MFDAKMILTLATGLIVSMPAAFAADDPIHERHELMEDVGKAAKPIGSMFRGETEYDAAVVMESLGVFEDVGSQFGDLFPEGTETGGDTEAAPAIWEDREGFEAALEEWRSAVDAAIEASPATLDEARPVVGEVFNACKNCHDGYRIDED